MKEINRVEGFQSGKVTCSRCGEKFHLYFNGGELDGQQCKCGLRYQTEAVRYDLVVYDTEAEREPEREPEREAQ